MSHKPCRKCGATKPLSDFPRRASMKDGTLNQCRACQAAYMRERRASNPKCAEVARAWREANKERLSEAGKAWYRKNKEEVNRKHREWYQENRESKLAANREWYYANRDSRLEQCRAWHAANPESARRSSARQWASKRQRCRARNAVNGAIRHGKLKRMPCVRCGSSENIQGHHWSYEEEHWLSVTWLCRECHIRAHKIIRSRCKDYMVRK
jgi:hypothetical protein